MLKILQGRLQRYVKWELPDVQGRFRKGRGTRDQIAHICCITEKTRVPEKHLFLLYQLRQTLWPCCTNAVWLIIRTPLITKLLLLLLLSRFSRVRLCATPWTAAYQAPPSMGFSRQEYWSGLPLPKLLTLGKDKHVFGYTKRPRQEEPFFWIGSIAALSLKSVFCK